uniref:Putative secreted protein n=1 Tax=Ixodes scapularis TaxID=6945 RepID=A0A4D5RZR8_IXOSC
MEPRGCVRVWPLLWLGHEGHAGPALRDLLDYQRHLGDYRGGVCTPAAQLQGVLVGCPHPGRASLQWLRHFLRNAHLQQAGDALLQMGEHQGHSDHDWKDTKGCTPVYSRKLDPRAVDGPQLYVHASPGRYGAGHLLAGDGTQHLLPEAHLRGAPRPSSQCGQTDAHWHHCGAYAKAILQLRNRHAMQASWNPVLGVWCHHADRGNHLHQIRSGTLCPNPDKKHPCVASCAVPAECPVCLWVRALLQTSGQVQGLRGNRFRHTSHVGKRSRRRNLRRIQV